jgi:peptidoglycan/LPS O-acetylase OafA/YrhL
VDTFFFLSAFLATLVMIRRLEKGNSVPIVGSVVHRFLRLSPAYLFVIMTYTALGPYLGDGPFWFNMKSGNTEPCERYWWTNLLYINNFHPKVYADQCVPWTWYLANDMQFFIIGVIITVAFHRHFKLATGVLFSMLVTSLILTGFIVADNNVQSFSMSDPGQYQNDVYDKPYTRIPSYLIGMFVAFLFTKTSVRIKGTFWVSVCVAMVFICTFVPCYVFHGEFAPTLSSWNVTQNVLYLTLARPMWTTGVAILTYLCICDVGGVFDWVLSLGLWDPMAKLSYSAYLVHPIIMRVFYFNRRSLFFWSVWDYTTYFVANLFISYAVAMVVYCSVETPFASLEKVVGDLGKRGRRERR